MPDRRSRRQRRWELGIAFPLIDKQGVTVISDRRQMADRRLENISLEDRLTLLSEMPPPGPGRSRDS